ncbi:MAG: ABC transporter ATP-binding protein [bacterium]|nr:ABC transporter ATP-binding protein [bacterium]
MIQVKNLYKSYSGNTVLHDLNFQINKGEIVGFLGPNGAGKTTTMRILTGYFPPTSGSAKIAGYDVVEESLESRKHFGYLPENVPLYYDLTVYEYLAYFAQLARVPSKLRKDEIASVIKKTALTDVKDKLISAISRGYRQRVGLAQALVGNPDVLILDEPTVGLDPVQIVEIRDLIKDLAKNQTVILSTHILPEVSQICNRVLIINQGKIVADGTVDDLIAKQASHSNLRLTVGGDPEHAREIIKKFRGVDKIDLVNDKQHDSLVVHSDHDIRKSLLRELVNHDIELLEFRSEVVDLESVFIKLVTHENK